MLSVCRRTVWTLIETRRLSFYLCLRAAKRLHSARAFSLIWFMLHCTPAQVFIQNQIGCNTLEAGENTRKRFSSRIQNNLHHVTLRQVQILGAIIDWNKMECRQQRHCYVVTLCWDLNRQTRISSCYYSAFTTGPVRPWDAINYLQKCFPSLKWINSASGTVCWILGKVGVEFNHSKHNSV